MQEEAAAVREVRLAAAQARARRHLDLAREAAVVAVAVEAEGRTEKSRNIDRNQVEKRALLGAFFVFS